MDKNKYWQEELDYLTSLIERTGLVKEIKWGQPLYTLNGKHVVGVGGFKSYFGLWFYKGVLMKDPKKLLFNAQEGKTQAMRQMRFQSMAEVDENIVMNYLNEAIAIEKQGLEVEFEKREVIAPELENKLSLDPVFAASFFKLTPYRQKEYHEYIQSAKQETTKLARIEKIVPMVLEGRGLNDKYKK